MHAGQMFILFLSAQLKVELWFLFSFLPPKLVSIAAVNDIPFNELSLKNAHPGYSFKFQQVSYPQLELLQLFVKPLIEPRVSEQKTANESF